MSLWKSLSSENPMLIEVRRYRRRLLGSGRITGIHIALLTLIAVCYVGLLLVVGSANGSIDPVAIILIQTGVFTLAAPAILNNSIAGEREKGTWDLLLVAPVTKAQIMIGKYAGAVTNLLLGAVLFLLPVFICALSYRQTNFVALAAAELDSIAFGMLACAITIFFSARCRRPFTALGVSLGLLLIGLVVYPILVGTLVGVDEVTQRFFFILHPFVGQADLIFDNGYHEGISGSALSDAALQIVVYLFLTAVTLVWTERTLTFSDNETKFLPKHHAGS